MNLNFVKFVIFFSVVAIALENNEQKRKYFVECGCATIRMDQCTICAMTIKFESIIRKEIPIGKNDVSDIHLKWKVSLKTI